MNFKKIITTLALSLTPFISTQAADNALDYPNIQMEVVSLDHLDERLDKKSNHSIAPHVITCSDDQMQWQLRSTSKADEILYIYHADEILVSVITVLFDEATSSHAVTLYIDSSQVEMHFDVVRISSVRNALVVLDRYASSNQTTLPSKCLGDKHKLSPTD